MKMTIAKLKKSTIVQKAIAGILTSSIALFSAMPVYAGTTVDQETLYPILRNSTTQYLYPVTGTTKTIYRLTNIADILAQFADQSTLNQKSIYTLLNTVGGYVDGIEGYVDGIEGYVDGIEGKIDTSNTHLNAIKGYVDTLETLVTTSNTHLNAIKGYVDGIEGKIDTSNTRLNDIKSAIQNITTYNYTQVLSDILTNTGYLSTIDTYTQSIQDSIGYGTTGDNVLSKLSAIITHTSDTNQSVIAVGNKLSRTFSRAYYFVGGRGSNGISNTPSASNGIVVNTNSPNTYIPFYTSSNNNSMQHTFADISNLTITDFIYLLTNNVTQFGSRIFTPYTIYRTNNADYADGVSNTGYFAYSLSDMFWALQTQSSDFFSRMGFVLADDDTITAKNANKPQEQSALTNFTGQGNASASASDFTQLSSAVTSVKSGLNTNASPTNVLGVFNSTDGFGWFSQATLDALDTTTQNTRGAKAVSNTPLYDSNYNAIMEYLTGSDRK